MTDTVIDPKPAGRKESYVNLYSIKTQAIIGKIEETTKDRVETRLASLNGRDYVLVMEGGTRLRGYVIAVPSR